MADAHQEATGRGMSRRHPTRADRPGQKRARDHTRPGSHPQDHDMPARHLQQASLDGGEGAEVCAKEGALPLRQQQPEHAGDWTMDYVIAISILFALSGLLTLQLWKIWRRGRRRCSRTPMDNTPPSPPTPLSQRIRIAEDKLEMLKHMEREEATQKRERWTTDLQAANAMLRSHNKELEDRLEILALRNRAMEATTAELRARIHPTGGHTPQDRQPPENLMEVREATAANQPPENLVPRDGNDMADPRVANDGGDGAGPAGARPEAAMAGAQALPAAARQLGVEERQQRTGEAGPTERIRMWIMQHGQFTTFREERDMVWSAIMDLDLRCQDDRCNAPLTDLAGTNHLWIRVKCQRCGEVGIRYRPVQYH